MRHGKELRSNMYFHQSLSSIIQIKAKLFIRRSSKNSLESIFFIWLFICCKTKLKIFVCLFEKVFVFFKKYTLFAEKKYFYKEKKFYNEKFFYWKNFFYREKYKWKCKKIYISFQEYIFTQKIFVLYTKYKSFLNIYSFCKNKVLIIKNKFVKTSLWNQ